MSEICQCGHPSYEHFLSTRECTTHVCNCPHFTPPVDEREKAVAELSRKWQLREGGGMGPGLRAYHRIYETGANDGFDAGWNARDAEVERLKKLLKRISEWDQLPQTADGPYWINEIQRALEEK